MDVPELPVASFVSSAIFSDSLDFETEIFDLQTGHFCDLSLCESSLMNLKFTQFSFDLSFLRDGVLRFDFRSGVLAGSLTNA
ncbi:hypothetical protein DERP_011314 [Dermatophagoides pteronyssinus]|uniref:Uncharacterized protein n=1 Tax=Dermatophagoides pteronyssinus TaxID=6956 RepID=A0ABQ8J7W4_DERPT|nr:hypothetical protein DERP_011314 [Dermatophagoides pteronyssinus]